MAVAEVRRRGTRTRGIVVPLAVACALVASSAFALEAHATRWPFDLRSVGVPCSDDPAWVCASIRVPFDRRHPRAGSLWIGYRILPRRRALESAGTIVVVAGGPGEASQPEHIWAERAFGPALDDHDLLLVDNRGTGVSRAIDCPQVQDTGFTNGAIDECAARLGARADDYGTVAAADDLEAVLTKIHTTGVELYGQSYGTYLAQVFARRYPDHLIRMVLDGPLPLDIGPWDLARLPAGFADLRAFCRVIASCHSSGDPAALLARVLPVLRAGVPRGDISRGAFEVAQVLENAGRTLTPFRELVPALRSYLAGDSVPLDRLLGDARHGSFGAPVGIDSDGLYLAVTCTDFPRAFDPAASRAAQLRQYAASYRNEVRSPAPGLGPFEPDEATVATSPPCFGWPDPQGRRPAALAGSFPDVPTLVLVGGFDTVTPRAFADRVTRELRHAREVEVPYVGHITATQDRTGCAASIAAAFLASGTTSTRCLARIRPPFEVGAFPRTFARESPITPLHGRAPSVLTADDLRTLAVGRDAVADVLWHWVDEVGPAQPGLRGGSFTTSRGPAPGVGSLNLDAVRWTDDTTVSGVISFAVGSPAATTADIEVTTPAGRTPLVISASGPRAGPFTETISGTFHGRPVDLVVDAQLGP